MTLLHELAHAWDASAPFDRQAFLEIRGLEHYFGPPGTPPAEQGAEHLAEIMAWGLMDVDAEVPGPAYESQPVAEFGMRLAGLPNSSPGELYDAFAFLTGCVPLHESGTGGTAAGNG